MKPAHPPMTHAAGMSAISGLPCRRRGVLLLVVLSMLTLFMLLGVAYVVTATRSREAARAYSRLTFNGDEVRVPHARLLDAVFLQVLRGSPGFIPGGAVDFESLLADKFGSGSSLNGIGTGFVPATAAGSFPAVLQGTLTFSNTLVRPAALNGRLLSFTEPGRPVTTHRIIRANHANGNSTNISGSSFNVTVDGGPPISPFALPRTFSRVVVNGREFDGSSGNEPWDGFDDANPYLAQVASGTTISSSTVSRISYARIPGGGLASSDAADNDNDGQLDGVFLDFGLPSVADAYGNSIELTASVLIIDLDGRFNVNAHDCLPRLIYTGSSRWDATVDATIDIASVPMGSGYGPAEVSGATGTAAWVSESQTAANGLGLFPGPPMGAPLQTTGTFSRSENPTVFSLVGGPSERMVGVRSGSSGSRFTDGQATPRLTGLEGRYGERVPPTWQNIIPSSLAIAATGTIALPGQPGTDDAASRLNDRRVPWPAVAEPPPENPPGKPFLIVDDGLNYGTPPRWWITTTSTSDNPENFNWGIKPKRVYEFPTGVTEVLDPLPRGIFNSPPDLHGRMRTITVTGTDAGNPPGPLPQVKFLKAEWSDAAAYGSHESADDPYELQLDTRRGFGGLLFDPAAVGGVSSGSVARDNPFTPAELEPVLRPYDIDTNRLPPRLPAMLGSVGEEARLKLTTDSWDTTAITGSAATVVLKWLGETNAEGLYGDDPLSGIIGGEVSRGERFDLNRPLTAASAMNIGYPCDPPLISSTYAFPGVSGTFFSDYHVQRHAYRKDLYTLCLALSPSSDRGKLAQWAANVAEFRDADSRVIPFEYDTNPEDGWDVDGFVLTSEPDRAVVWGAERPEIVIQEAAAWATSSGTGMVITLHRPWNATAHVSDTSSKKIPAEPCDYAFDTLSNGTSGRPQNIVDLGKKPGSNIYGPTYSTADVLDVSGTVYPIWRLRIVAGGTQYLAFTGTSEHWIGVDAITAGQPTPKIGANSSLTIYSGTAIIDTTGTAYLAISGSNKLEVPALKPLAAVSGTIFLERLSDPTVRLTTSGSVPGTKPGVTGTTVWSADPANSQTTNLPLMYLVVDSMRIEVEKNLPLRPIGRSPQSFWAGVNPTPLIESATTRPWPTPLVTSGTPTQWLPWPNRPFASSVELMLVPQGNANEIVKNHEKFSPARSGTQALGFGIPVATELFFDAVHVPTRYAGIHRTCTQSLAGTTGIHNRVTVVNQLSSFREPGRVNLNTVVADEIWKAVVAGPLRTPATSREASGFASTPAKNLAEVLSLSAINRRVVVSDSNSTVLPSDLNPLHAIYTATRLANTTTPRSGVFAVWVTLRERALNNADSPRFHRAFYIVDRSIPVAFEEGKDHNVWDCVRLRRIIE